MRSRHPERAARHGTADSARLLLTRPRRAHPRLAQTHIVFSTGCTSYFDWQALGLAYSLIHSGWPSETRLTRLMSTCDSDSSRLRSTNLPYMTTHEHPDFGDPLTNGLQDAYAPYNKPGGVAHWLDAVRSTLAGDYVLVVEADMLLRAPIDCEALGVRPGVAAAARYEYLIGASNGMARGFVKNAHLVQPVGGWMCLHRDDLREVAPLWLDFTKQVRWHVRPCTSRIGATPIVAPAV